MVKVVFNQNKGYVGDSRSVRSQEAIESYEVPISMINKALIDDFLFDYEDDFSSETLKFLKTLTVAKWKYIAKEKVPASSWHHTSAYYNQTHHYDLHTIAEEIIRVKDTLDEDYKTYKQEQNRPVSNVQFAVMKVQVWGGTRKRPKLEGYEEVTGIIIGDWLYFKENHDKRADTKKYKCIANKVESLKKYESYDDLIKQHKQYKSTKRIFNQIISEKMN